MNLLEMILNFQNGGAVRQLAQNFGLEQDQAASAIANLVPALSSGLMRNMSTGDGLQNLLGALGNGQHQRYLDDISTLGQPEAVADGNGILSHVLGSKDVSRQAGAKRGCSYYLRFRHPKSITPGSASATRREKDVRSLFVPFHLRAVTGQALRKSEREWARRLFYGAAFPVWVAAFPGMRNLSYQATYRSRQSRR
jgi:uncharacterized protein YidB (DUF937 family)